MAWVLLTGTIAVFAVELDWLTRPALRVMPQEAAHASWGTLATAARGAAPDGEVTIVMRGPHAWFATEALARDADGTRFRVYLDPYSGVVRGTGGWTSFHRFFREMHRHLLMPAWWGIPLVCSLSLLMLASLVTGLVSYKKFWRGFTRIPRGGNARRLSGDLHRLGGLWSIWFVLLIALTSVWYLVESLGGDAPFSRPPVLEARATSTQQQSPPPPDSATIDRLAAAARAAYPSLDIRQLMLPTTPGGAIGFAGQADAVLVRDRANAVWLDPTDARVVRIERGEALSAHQRLSELADPLHFGTFGGMTTKVLWFVFGAVSTALAITGAMIYSLRLASAATPVERAIAKSGPVMRVWRGMGLWAYPSAIIVLASLAMLPGWLAQG